MKTYITSLTSEEERKRKTRNKFCNKKKRSIKIKLKQFVGCAVTINQVEFHLGPLGIMITYIFFKLPFKYLTFMTKEIHIVVIYIIL